MPGVTGCNHVHTYVPGGVWGGGAAICRGRKALYETEPQSGAPVAAASESAHARGSKARGSSPRCHGFFEGKGGQCMHSLSQHNNDAENDRP
jgi:hypothetical protein